MKHKLLLFILIFFGLVFAVSVRAALHCETDTTRFGVLCRSNLGKSWCYNNGAVSAEDCAVESTAAQPTGGPSTFSCVTNSWVCNSGYTLCSNVCKQNSSVPMPPNCQTVNICTEQCTVCNSGYALCGSNYTCYQNTCAPGQTFVPCTQTCTGFAGLKLGYDSASDNSVIRSNTYPTLYIPTSSNVGIGTTAPGAKLDVAGSFLNSLAVTHSALGGGGSLAVMTDNSGVLYTAAGTTLPTGTSGQTLRHNGTIWAADSNLFNNGTNVGIGTTAPGAKLDVVGNLRTTSAGTSINTYRSTGTGATGRSVLQLLRDVSGVENGWDLGSNTALDSTDNFVLRSVVSGTAVSRLVVTPANGSVGIGTTSPDGKLHVMAGSAGSVTAYGNSTLTLEESADNNFLSFLSPAGKNQGILFGDADANWRGQIQYNHTNDMMYFWTAAGVGKMVIDSSGSVGIGTTSPSYPLHVVGNIGTNSGGQNFVARYTTNETYKGTFGWNHLQLGNNGANDIIAGRTNVNGFLRFWVNATNDYTYDNSNGTLAMTIASSGNVGINTTAPGAKLDVAGSFLNSLAVTHSALGGGGNLVVMADNSGVLYTAAGTTSAIGQLGRPGHSCLDIKTQNRGAADGVYWISPDGNAPIQVYCDMTRDGGGWTLMLKSWYNGGVAGNTGAVGVVADATTRKGNPYKLSDSAVNAIIGPTQNFDIMADQNGYNTYYSTGNYEYVLLRNYTGLWRFDTAVSASITTTTMQSYRISDNALAWTGNITCGTGGYGINCVDLSIGNPQGGAGCDINMGAASNAGWHHFFMSETNTDTYLYICNGAQHSSSFDMNHRFWVRERAPSGGLWVIAGKKLQISNGDASTATFGPNLSWGGKLLVGSGTNQALSLTAQVLATDGNLHIDPAPGKNIYLGYWQARDIYINPSGGSVGIGTTAPGAKLDVNGTINASNLILKKVKTYTINSLGASAAQAKRYEIARATIDYNDWNSGIGPIIVELFENYFGQGNYKKYIISWGYNNTSYRYLAENNNVYANNANVNVGTPVQISGDNYYLPIYVDVRYYGNVDVRITTNRTLTTSNPPGLHEMYIDEAPTGTNIDDFTPDSIVIQPSTASFSGSVGIGTTSPGKPLEVNGQGKFNNFAYGLTPDSGDNPALTTVEYVNLALQTGGGSGNLCLNGCTIGGDIDMDGHNITNVATLGTVTKLTVTTIDPLYHLNGVNYATFVASISGGVKEEYLDKIKLTKKNKKTGEFEAVIDFSDLEEGSDLWVWRQVVDFNKDNVEVFITPYGRFASVYYLIDGDKLIFRSDCAVEISYRLIGKRFDWRDWPTRAADQTIQGLKVK